MDEMEHDDIRTFDPRIRLYECDCGGEAPEVAFRDGEMWCKCPDCGACFSSEGRTRVEEES